MENRYIIICMLDAMTGKSKGTLGVEVVQMLRKFSPGSGYLLSNLSFRFSHRTLGLTLVSVIKIHYIEQ